MHGVVNLLKPPGMTSHDAVSLLRRVTGVKRIGHMGTLDPAAAGVLPLCIGQATRLIEDLQVGGKTYIAEITFGHETDTLDAMGEIVFTASAKHINRNVVDDVLDKFRGAIEQVPPLYSAIKQDGKKLYELARKGMSEDEVPLKKREVTIDALSISHFVAAENDSPPRAMLHVECSAGTYIRSLVRDIGRELGCGATMTFLVRTRSGAFGIEQAATIEQVSENIATAMIPLTEALRWCAHRWIIDDEITGKLAQGKVVHCESLERVIPDERYPEAEIVHAHAPENQALFLNENRTIAALALHTDNGYKPDKVFNL